MQSFGMLNKVVQLGEPNFKWLNIADCSTEIRTGPTQIEEGNLPLDHRTR
jgi:hypothetical protein